MSERDFSAKEPEFEPGVHPDVARECLETWRLGHPWTRIRVLEKGVDDPSGQQCSNSQGKFNVPCSKKIEAVQYTSAQANPIFFCEEHALEQNDWDNILYWDRPPEVKREEDPDAVEGESVADQVKRSRKKRQELEPEPREDLEDI